MCIFIIINLSEKYKNSTEIEANEHILIAVIN